MTYRYYMTQRPPSPGAQPGGNINLVSYDTKTEGAWGYVEYREPLTEKQIEDYELEIKNKEETEMTENRTSGVFKMWNRLDDNREEFVGASKRIEVCVRDYKKFLERGKGPRKLEDIVERLVSSKICSLGEAIEGFEYKIVEQTAPESVQEAKDRWIAGETANEETEESRDEKILRLIAEGNNKTKVAELVGVSRSTVNRTANA